MNQGAEVGWEPRFSVLMRVELRLSVGWRFGSPVGLRWSEFEETSSILYEMRGEFRLYGGDGFSMEPWLWDSGERRSK